MVDEFSCAEQHLTGDVGPGVDDGGKFSESMFCSEQKGKDVLWGRAFGDTLEKGLAELGIERSEFLSAPALTEETDESTTSTTLKVSVFDVLFKGEFEDTRGTPCALSATTATRAPFALSETLILLKGKKGMEEAMEHFKGDANLDLVVEGGERKIQSSLEDGKSSGEIVGAT